MQVAQERTFPKLLGTRSRHPSLRDVPCDTSKPNRLIRQFLARRGIPSVSLLEDFRTHFGADARPGFFTLDIHLAPAGHELAAAVMERGLRDLHLVP
jgi:hypothetical protein